MKMAEYIEREAVMKTAKNGYHSEGGYLWKCVI